MAVRRPLARLALMAALAAGLAGPALADRALLIGIDSYLDTGLGYVASGSSARDVASVEALLTGRLGYAPADIKVLADAAASREAILSTFDEWLSAGTAPGERVFLYFSGLGYFQADQNGDEADGLDEALVPADARVNGTDVAGLITDDELDGLIGRLADRKVTVVVDAGFSGIVSSGSEAADTSALRAPRIGGRTRSIVVEPAARAQKAEGEAFDTARLTGDIAFYSAASGGQAALVADGGGLFTAAFIEALTGSVADANGNGTVSNAEVLAYARSRSEAGCGAVPACQLGLTPTLGPGSAAGAALILPVADVAAPAAAGKMTPDFVLDYFGKGNTHGVSLEMIPASPVPAGARNIRFRITSPVEGSLILLDLSDEGELTQLFPNEFTRRTGREGVILAGSPITVPDAYYGISFDATSPSTGTLIALVTNGPVEMPTTVRTRSIEIIPRQEAAEVFLPAIAETLNQPANTAEPTATISADWSVATLRYAIATQ